MHVNRTFSLKISTVEDLNDKVRSTLRSKFVDRAIQERLSPQEINTELLSTRRLISILMNRDVSEHVKRTLAIELGIQDVEAYL